MVKTTCNPGDKVFAKVKGYPPWPAKIVSDTGKKKFNVLFYGTNETGAIKPEDLYDYDQFKNNFGPKYGKRGGYQEALEKIAEDVNGEPVVTAEESTTSQLPIQSDKKGTKRNATSLPAQSSTPKKVKGKRANAAAEAKPEESNEPTLKKLRSSMPSNVHVEESADEVDPELKSDPEEAAGNKSRQRSISSPNDSPEELTTNNETKSVKKKLLRGRTKGSANVQSDSEPIKTAKDNDVKTPAVTKRRTRNATSSSSQNDSATEESLDKKTNDHTTAEGDDEEQTEAKEETISVKSEHGSDITEITTTSVSSPKADNAEQSEDQLPQEPIIDKTLEVVNPPEPTIDEPSVDETLLLAGQDNTAPPVEKDASTDVVETSSEPVTIESNTKKDSQSKKYHIVSALTLKYNIFYADYIAKSPDSYKSKLIEDRQDTEFDVLPVVLPSGIICGIKLHKQWPITSDTEYDRAIYDKTVAKTALDAKDALTSGKKSTNDVNVEIIPKLPTVTVEDIKILNEKVILDSNIKVVEILKHEAELLKWDSQIRANVGLYKAKPDHAIEVLQRFERIEKHVTTLMFQKHPHVLDTVRRLCKYIGNLNDWDLSETETHIFRKKAEKLRNEAETVYGRIQKMMPMKDESDRTYWETFLDYVTEFRTNCKELNENDILMLTAEPGSRRAIINAAIVTGVFELSTNSS